MSSNKEILIAIIAILIVGVIISFAYLERVPNKKPTDDEDSLV